MVTPYHTCKSFINHKAVRPSATKKEINDTFPSQSPAQVKILFAAPCVGYAKHGFSGDFFDAFHNDFEQRLSFHVWSDKSLGKLITYKKTLTGPRD